MVITITETEIAKKACKISSNTGMSQMLSHVFSIMLKKTQFSTVFYQGYKIGWYKKYMQEHMQKYM